MSPSAPVATAYCLGVTRFSEIGDGAQVESVGQSLHIAGAAPRASWSRALEVTNDRRLAFLSMDPRDWPQQLCGRLGKDNIGRVARFRKALPGSA